MKKTTTTTKKATAKTTAKTTKKESAVKKTTKKPAAKKTKLMPEATGATLDALISAPMTIDDLKAKGVAVKPLDPAKVSALTIGINLTCIRFGNTRRADMSEVDMHGTDHDMVMLTKQLLKSKELSAIHMLDYRAGEQLRRIGLPSFFKPGTHRIPIALVDEAEKMLAEFAEERAALVDAFIEKYPALIESMREPLGPQFKASDYPTPESARARFTFKWEWFEVGGVPDRLATISSAVYASAVKKVEASMLEVAQGCRTALRAACLEIVQTISERLTPKNGDERKKFRSSTLLRDATEFFRTFELRNVTDDAELAAVVDKLRNLTNGVDLDTVKTDAALQVAFKASVDAVAKDLDALLVDATDRKIVLV